MRSILALWDAVVVSVAVIAIVVIAFGLMIRVIEPMNALRRIGAALGCVVILFMVPPLIINLWHSLSLLQQMGIITLLGIVGGIALRNRPSCRRTERSEH